MDPRSGWLINTGPTRHPMERITCWRDEIAGAGNWRTLEDWISESGKWKKGGKKASNISQSNFIFVENVLFFYWEGFIWSSFAILGQLQSWVLNQHKSRISTACFLYIGTRPLFLKWKFRPITTLTLHIAVLWDVASLDPKRSWVWTLAWLLATSRRSLEVEASFGRPERCKIQSKALQVRRSCDLILPSPFIQWKLWKTACYGICALSKFELSGMLQAVAD